MKVFLSNASLFGLRRHLQKFGDELVMTAQDAELVLSQNELPSVVLESLWSVTPLSSSHRPSHFISRFAFEGKLCDQVIVGVPIWGTCNENLGAEEVGCVAVRFLPEGSFSELFYNGLHVVLEETKYTGFVSCCFSIDSLRADSTDRVPYKVCLGLPWWSVYALLENIGGSLTDFWLSPWRMRESWSVSLPVLRGCYPGKLIQKITIGGLDPMLTEHVHLWEKGLENTQQFVGVVTSSHVNLDTCLFQVLQIADRLRIPEKQYRTDIKREVKYRWGELRPHVLKPVGSSVSPSLG
jgi:hypothetical protein